MARPLRLWIFAVSLALGIVTGFVAWFLWNVRHYLPDGLKVAIIVGGLVGLGIGREVIRASGVEIARRGPDG